MKGRKVFAIAIFFCIVSFVRQTHSENNASQNNYSEIVKLSRKIKKFERQKWHINPVSFATRIPKSAARNHYFIAAQDKLKLESNYASMDFFEITEKGPKSRLIDELNKKFAGKDVFVSEAALSLDREVPAVLSEVSIERQIDVILHEDFHDIANLPWELRSIEESFADAYASSASYVMAKELFRDEQLFGNVRDFIEKQNSKYEAINSCYDKFDAIYKSNKTKEEKISLRGSIPGLSCSGDELQIVNNAFLSAKHTYTKYYFYGRKIIAKFGIDKFLKAYMKTARNTRLQAVPSEAEWIEKFEKNLKQKK